MDGAVMARFRLGVKMCGNCNPDIRCMFIVQRIARALDAVPVAYDEGGVKLTVSACQTACVERDYPAAAVIRGFSVNGQPCRDENEIIEKALACLAPYFQQETENGS